MKKRFPVMLLLCLLLLVSVPFSPADADADSRPDQFVFRNGITWEMSQQEVTRLEGDSFHLDRNRFSVFHYSDVVVSRYTGYLFYAFASDRLVLCGYYSSFTREDCDYLEKALDRVYGKKAEPSAELLSAAVDCISHEGYYSEDLFDPDSLRAWEGPGNTLIMLVSEKPAEEPDSYSYSCSYILYCSPSFSSVISPDYVDTTGL